jgi:protein CWC15
MTTAARPTYHAAIGGKLNYGGFKSRAVCAKDQAAHTKLKFRQLGQSTEEEVKNLDLRHDLDRKEQEHLPQKNKAIAMILQEERKVDVPLLIKNKPEADEAILKKFDDSDVDNGSDDGFDSSRYTCCLIVNCSP